MSPSKAISNTTKLYAIVAQLCFNVKHIFMKQRPIFMVFFLAHYKRDLHSDCRSLCLIVRYPVLFRHEFGYLIGKLDRIFRQDAFDQESLGVEQIAVVLEVGTVFAGIVEALQAGE